MIMSTKPTWKQVMEIMKELQVKYQLPIFAATYQGSCSCCARPKHFNKESYLTPDVKDLSWDEIDSDIVFLNAFNGSGEACLNDYFGVVNQQDKTEVAQYVGYKLSERFTKSDLDECLTELVNRINELSDTKYALTLPKDTNRCAVIENGFVTE